MTSKTDILACLQEFAPISLEEMEGVKLMNRIDTKFVVQSWLLPEILQNAKHTYFAQEINEKRIVTYDTMYYDTDDLEMYLRHHDRQLVRQKIRIRQYVESHLNFLEIKRKNNKGRTKKKRITLPNPEMTRPTSDVVEFIAAKSRYTWEQISPKLRTVFHRITLVNKAKTERLTIDFDLVWENQVSGMTKTYPDLVIIELKRNGHVPSPMLGIMQLLRIKPLKISKYCIGTALTTPHLKRNRFKKKIRLIEKLLNINPQNYNSL